MLLIALLGQTQALFAENDLAYMQHHHEIRIGWGDQLFESLIWHNPTSVITNMPASSTYSYKEQYRYHQHLWAEYQYRFTHWFGLGGMVDVSEVGWDMVNRDGTGKELNRNKNNYFYNIVIMPTIRFTYFHHENVNIYSGLGLGMDINGGTETDGKGRHTVVAPAINFALVGISANYDRWFIAFDYGGMYALTNINHIYMAKSRMLNLSIGARF